MQEYTLHVRTFICMAAIHMSMLVEVVYKNEESAVDLV